MKYFVPKNISRSRWSRIRRTARFNSILVAATGDLYYGLWYPIVIAGATLVIGLFFLPETFKRNVDA
jgi:hypothetical protein